MTELKDKTFIGIDVSKAAIRKYIRALEFSENLYVIIDLTGGYEAQCVDEFYAMGIHVIRAEGRKVKSFARALGISAKTDKLDARILAQYGEKCFDKLRLYEPRNNQIKKLVMRLSDIKHLLQQEKNRLKAPDNISMVVKSIKLLINVYGKEIEKLETEIENIIKQDELLWRKYYLLTEQRGIGKRIAFILLGLLPELGCLNRRQIAALAGVAPLPKTVAPSAVTEEPVPVGRMLKKLCLLPLSSLSAAIQNLRMFIMT